MSDTHEPGLPGSRIPPRRRRLWPFFLLAPVVLVVVVFVIALLRSDRRLQQAIAQTDRLDPHWRLEDIEADREVVPEAENSALTVVAAKQKIPPRWPSWDYPPLPPPLPPEPPEDQPPGGPEEMPPGGAPEPPDPYEFSRRLSELPPPVQLSAEQVARVREEMAKAREALALAGKLAEQPRGHHDIAWSKDFLSTMLPGVQDTREVANLLSYDVLLRAQEKDLEGALRSCLALRNAAGSIWDTPTFIAVLVQIAVRSIAVRKVEHVLAQGEPPAAALIPLQEAFEQDGELPLFLIGLRGERAGSNRFFEAIQRGDVSVTSVRNNLGLMASVVGSGKQQTWLAEENLLYLPGVIANNRAALLERMNEMIEAQKLPAAERDRRMAEIEAAVPEDPILVRMIMSSVSKIGEASHRHQAELRCAAAALAVERYRQKHGRWPDDLKALTPEFLKAVPTDPYDEQPLRYRKDPEGVVVYTVGADRKDDGGVFDTLNRYGSGSDFGFRLWHPEKRRQPQK